MKAIELRQLSLAELQNRLDDAKAEYFNLRFQAASGQLADTNRLRTMRQDIARILTLIGEMSVEAEHAE
jgi:large subunit ribosomal protein L29